MTKYLMYIKTHGHTHAKYEVPCLSLQLGQLRNDDTDDDAQSMLVQGSLVDKPNNPKTSSLLTAKF